MYMLTWWQKPTIIYRGNILIWVECTASSDSSALTVEEEMYTTNYRLKGRWLKYFPTPFNGIDPQSLSTAWIVLVRPSAGFRGAPVIWWRVRRLKNHTGEELKHGETGKMYRGRMINQHFSRFWRGRETSTQVGMNLSPRYMSMWSQHWMSFFKSFFIILLQLS